MKLKLFASTVLAILLLVFCHSATASEVVGGYLNTQNEEGVIVYNLAAGKELVVAFMGEEQPANSGRLIVVYPDGNWREYTRAVKDSAGVVVAPRRGAHNKFIFIDERYRIIGASGLDASEFFDLIKTNGRTMALGEGWRLGAERTVFESIRLVAGVFQQGYNMSADEQLAAFTSHLRFLEPLPVADAISDILDSAAINDSFVIGAIEEMFDKTFPDIKPLARGVDLIAAGDAVDGYILKGWAVDDSIQLPPINNCLIPMSGDAIFLASR